MSEKNNNGEIKELSYRDVVQPFCKAYCEQFMKEFPDSDLEMRKASMALVDPLTSLGGVHFEGAALPSDFGKKLYAACSYLESLNNKEAERHARALALVSCALAGLTIYVVAAWDLATREQQQSRPVGHC